MNKKLALLVYPNFSLQEISSICSLFLWEYGCETVVFASSMDAINAEEGLLIQPHKTFDEFQIEDYDCLILSGCSDWKIAINDPKIKAFLSQFKDNKEFVIGAICAGPIFLAQAGLLEHKKFTNSLFVEMNQLISFIDENNLLYEAVVTDENMITATGFAFHEFAIEVARKVGYTCPDHIFTGPSTKKKEDYIAHLNDEDLTEFKEEFKALIHS